MKSPDLSKIDDDELLKCLQCGNIDTARYWKGDWIAPICTHYGACTKCGSEAFIVLEADSNG